MTRIDIFKEPGTAAQEMLDTFTAMAGGDYAEAAKYASNYADEMRTSPDEQERAIGEKLKSLVSQPR